MTRLLFVDDEVRVLSGLRRQLHGRVTDWDLRFASGGEQAVEWLEPQAFDAVITDMRMPVVDGRAVLAACAERCPDAARLVLSGQTDDDGLASVGAHRVLEKPCEPDRLVLEVQQALGMVTARRAASPGVAALWAPPRLARPGLEAVLAASGGEPAEIAGAVARRLDADDELRRRVLGLAAALDPENVSPRDRPEDATRGAGPTVLLTLTLAVELLSVADGDHWDGGWHAACRAWSAHGGDHEQRAAAAAGALLAPLGCPEGRADDGPGVPRRPGAGPADIAAGSGAPTPPRAAGPDADRELLAWLLPAWGLPAETVQTLRETSPSAHPAAGPISQP